MSASPLRALEYAMREQSGDHAASRSTAAWRVNLVFLRPFDVIVKMSMLPLRDDEYAMRPQVGVGPAAANVAVTARARSIVTVQVPVPAHAPLQPENTEPGTGSALRV